MKPYDKRDHDRDVYEWLGDALWAALPYLVIALTVTGVVAFGWIRL